MIAKLYFEYGESTRHGCFFREAATGRILAEAVDGAAGAAILRIDGREITVGRKPRVVTKVPINTPYPLSSGAKKTLGFSIAENGKSIGCYYGEATTVEKCGIFKKKLVLTVYSCFSQNVTVYRIGFAKENFHFYRVVDAAMRTVAMVQRNYSEEEPARATIYVAEDRYLLLAMIVCAGEVLAGVGCGPISYGSDASAGNYVSIKEAEKKMMDKAFIDQVKAQSIRKGEFPYE